MENSESPVRMCARSVKAAYVVYDGKPDGLNALCAVANQMHENGNYYTVITRDNGHYIKCASLSGDEGMFLVGEDKPVIVLDKFIKAMTMEEFNKFYRPTEDNKERIFRARVHMEADLRIDLPGESKDQVRGSIDDTFVDTIREAMKGAYGGRVDVMGVGGNVESVTELVKQTITVEK